MAGNVQVLQQAAEALEKIADWHEAVETQRRTEQDTARKKTASDLATQISGMTGEPVKEEVVSKLAETDPELQSIIRNLAGLSSDTVDSMGDVQTEKKASSDSDVPPEDAAFFEAMCED